MATISQNLIDRYSAAPSPTRTTAVASLQTRIRDVLGDTNWDTFLQGSYRNDTAIADINDVDIVARRKGWNAPLTPTQWEGLFNTIAGALRGSYRIGGAVSVGDKCVKLTGSSSGLSADIVPAVAIANLVNDPIAVYSRGRRQERPNYPRTHYRNGVAKQTRTGNTYKATVRLFKRWAGQYSNYASFAPSFYVECAVYKAPDVLFTAYLPRSFWQVGRQILSWGDHAVIASVAGDKDVRVPGEWEVGQFQEFKHKLARDVALVGSALVASTTLEADRLWKLAFGQ
jgi:hypothetical protein